MVGLNLQPATNKASFGRKATLGLRQIAALMAPSMPTQSQNLLRAPSCRQFGNLLHLLNVAGNKPERMKLEAVAEDKKQKRKMHPPKKKTNCNKRLMNSKK